MGSKRHLAEPGRKRLAVRLALGLLAIYAIRQHITLRNTAHERLVALQAMKSTGIKVDPTAADTPLLQSSSIE